MDPELATIKTHWDSFRQAVNEAMRIEREAFAETIHEVDEAEIPLVRNDILALYDRQA